MGGTLLDSPLQAQEVAHQTGGRRILAQIADVRAEEYVADEGEEDPGSPVEAVAQSGCIALAVRPEVEGVGAEERRRGEIVAGSKLMQEIVAAVDRGKSCGGRNRVLGRLPGNVELAVHKVLKEVYQKWLLAVVDRWESAEVVAVLPREPAVALCPSGY